MTTANPTLFSAEWELEVKGFYWFSTYHTFGLEPTPGGAAYNIARLYRDPVPGRGFCSECILAARGPSMADSRAPENLGLKFTFQPVDHQAGGQLGKEEGGLAGQPLAAAHDALEGVQREGLQQEGHL